MGIEFQGKVSVEDALWGRKNNGMVRFNLPFSNPFIQYLQVVCISAILCSIVFKYGSIAIISSVAIPLVLFYYFKKHTNRKSVKDLEKSIENIHGLVFDNKILFKVPYLEMHMDWKYFKDYLLSKDVMMLRHQSGYTVISKSLFSSESDWFKYLDIIKRNLTIGISSKD